MKKREPVAVITEDSDGGLFIEDGRSDPIKIADAKVKPRGVVVESHRRASPTQGARMTRWSEATKVKARAMGKTGKSHTEIGRILGVSRGTVDTWFWTRAVRERKYAERIEAW